MGTRSKATSYRSISALIQSSNKNKSRCHPHILILDCTVIIFYWDINVVSLSIFLTIFNVIKYVAVYLNFTDSLPANIAKFNSKQSFLEVQ